jgi:quercetin dioxygenase-like cupin family protein
MESKMRVGLALSAVAVLLCLAPILSAQDAVKVDPKHYTVVSENDQVRILKVHYGPHEKSVMHSHPASVGVYLTDGTTHFTFPDRKTMDSKIKAGEASYYAAVTHLPEDQGDKPFELILVELKGKGGAGKAAAAKPAAKTDNK